MATTRAYLTLLTAFLLIACSRHESAEPETTAKSANPPNIVLILSDDQGWDDYGFMGHPDIQTPHLDTLARNSLLFRRGYVAAPVCRPSLASMATGLYPFDHYVTGNDVSSSREPREEEDRPLRQRFYQNPNFIQMLSDHGYLSHQSGKWWEGSYRDGGFTHGMKEEGRHGSKESLAIGREGLEPISEFIDMALEQKKPFFVWYGVFLPHTPHNPPKHILEKYLKEGRSGDVAKYYAMCEWFDQTCGELLKLLDDRNLRENTLVIYICDNGWIPRSLDPVGKFPFAHRSKNTPYEKGIRTPIMLNWPGTIEPTDDPNFAHAIDIFPTIAAAAGFPVPDQLPGINLMDQQARGDRKAIFGTAYSTHNMVVGSPHETLQYLWCIEGDWKLLLRYRGFDNTPYALTHEWDTAPVRLYNLAEDPYEKNDVAHDHPEVVRRLREKIGAWYPGPAP